MTKFKFITQALDLEDSLLDTINIKKKLLLYWLFYTSLFIIIFFIGFWEIWANNLSLIWIGDGHNQMLVVMKYIGEYWRTFFSNIVSGNFQFPMFDFRFGLGYDIIHAMSNNQFAGIFHLLSAFVPSRHVDVYYDFVVIFRIYLSGLAFSIFCIYARQKYWAILIGSLCYACSGFVLKFILHPMFPMVYTPLLFLGIDLILRKKKPFLFIICIFLMTINSFYYLYIITVFLIIYALLRVHHLHGKLFWKNLLPSALRVTMYYTIGLLMSAVIFLPTILGFLDSARTGISNFLGSDGQEVINYFLYSYDTVIHRIFFFLTMNELYIAGIVVIALAVLFLIKTNKNDKRHLIVFFLLSWLLYLIPLGGLLLNGFAYVTDRWSFLFYFIICFITVYMLQKKFFLGNSKKTAIVMLIISLVIYFVEFGLHLDPVSANYFMLVCTVICIVVFSFLNISHLQKKIIILILAAVNLSANAYILNKYWNSKLVAPKNAAMEWHLELPNVPESIKKNDDSFYRMDTPKPNTFSDPYPLSHLANAPLFLDYYGNSIYLSILNKNLIKGFKELENNNVYDTVYYGFDGRTVLNTLASNKYYALKYEVERGENDKPYINFLGTNIIHPYGYTLYETDELHYQLTFENNYFLPLGYTYDKAISYNEYEKLNALEKQEIMLQAVALNADWANVRVDRLLFTTKEIPVQYQPNGCTWEDGIIYKTQEDSSLTLFFEGKKNSETYIQLSGLNKNEYSIFNIFIDNKIYTFKDSKAELMPDQERHLFNLGYSEEGLTSATIFFLESCALEGIKVYCYPMDNYPGQVNALKEETLENINISTNHVSGEITVSKDKFLVMSIPYSKGWSAKVNGIETELLQANTMFMALPLPAGKHTIELSYCTPGIKLGCLLSVMGFAAFIFLIIKGSQRYRRGAKTK